MKWHTGLSKYENLIEVLDFSISISNFHVFQNKHANTFLEEDMEFYQLYPHYRYDVYHMLFICALVRT